MVKSKENPGKPQAANQDNIHQHTAQFRDKAHDLTNDVQQLGKITREIAQDTMGILKENAGDYYEKGMDKAKIIEKDLEGRIKENPLQSLLIAVGLGFLVGLLIRRH